jgi:hypothetical protein
MRRWMRMAAFSLMMGMPALAMTQVLPVRGPLGIDRLLVGTVSKTKVEKKGRTKESPKRALYELTSAEGEKFPLHGHEAELKKLIGRKVRLTGHAVGNEVTVNSVEVSENQ